MSHNNESPEDDGKLGLSVYVLLVSAFLFWVGLIGFLITPSKVFGSILVISIVCMLVVAIIGSFIN